MKIFSHFSEKVTQTSAESRESKASSTVPRANPVLGALRNLLTSKKTPSGERRSMNSLPTEIILQIVKEVTDIDSLLSVRESGEQRMLIAVDDWVGKNLELSRALAAKHLAPFLRCGGYHDYELLASRLTELAETAKHLYLHFPYEEYLTNDILSWIEGLDNATLENTERVTLSVHGNNASGQAREGCYGTGLENHHFDRSKFDAPLERLRKYGPKNLQIDFSLRVPLVWADDTTTVALFRWFSEYVRKSNNLRYGLKYDEHHPSADKWIFEDGEMEPLLEALEGPDSKTEAVHMDRVVFVKKDLDRLIDAATKENGALRSLRLPCNDVTPDEFAKFLKPSGLQELEVSLKPETEEEFADCCRSIEKSSIKTIRIGNIMYYAKHYFNQNHDATCDAIIASAMRSENLICVEFTGNSGYGLAGLYIRTRPQGRFEVIPYENRNVVIDGLGMMDFEPVQAQSDGDRDELGLNA